MRPIRGFRYCAAVLAGIMMIPCWVSSGRADTSVYVDASSGSDITGNGSQAKPWQTIGKALDSITGTSVNPCQVLVAQGTYHESRLNPDQYESVFGGYNPANWDRDIDTYRTVVDGGGEEMWIFRGEDHCTFDGLYLQNAGEGVFCWSSSPNIRRCHISNCEMGIATSEGATIRQNVLVGNGYAIFGGPNTGFITRIYNNLIVLNTEGSVPSGIASGSNNMYCINNTIDSNEYGIRIQKASDELPPVALIQNNNITRNGSSSHYDGIYLSDSEYFGVDPDLITIRYNNVWDNGTDYDGCVPGEGDISQDPLYRSPAGAGGSGYERLPTAEVLAREEDRLLEMEAEKLSAWERGYSVTKGRSTIRRGGEIMAAVDYDYQLFENSPSIDAGTNENAPSEDILGALRPNPSTAIADIGCYEYYSTPAPPASPPWTTDFNGDGTSDIAVFRESSGLWAIRQVTRAYFGSSSDRPVPADYTGDGTTNIAIFRESNGLWSVSGGQRTYFGGSGDLPVPGDYTGDGTANLGIYRESTRLWVVKGVTRAYFGSSGDSPVPGYWAGDGSKSIGVFRPANGLWIIRGITRSYFGSASDTVVPGDYNGDGSWDPGVFRPASGLWSVKGVTRTYFGQSTDLPIPGGYRGDGRDCPGIFRNGLWVIKGVTRAYFGSGSDVPVTR